MCRRGVTGGVTGVHRGAGAKRIHRSDSTPFRDEIAGRDRGLAWSVAPRWRYALWGSAKSVRVLMWTRLVYISAVLRLSDVDYPAGASICCDVAYYIQPQSCHFAFT